ncbi:MAG: PLDc_N domain-containing protein [Chloroflexi bacterium]|nr:PLDc_N domain-containing protein [Chloroflexota bacterium]
MMINGSGLAMLLPLILVLALLQLVLLIAALFDLAKPERRVKGDSKVVWVIIILVFQLLGPLAYFIVGREDS